jgi:hypothetical protein
MSRTIGGVAVLAALLLSFNALPVELLDLACPQTNRFGDRVSLAEEARKTHRLDELSEQVAERLALKDELAEQLMAGERTLLETAARFRALHQKCGPLPDVQMFYGTASEGEGWCRQVISWMEAKVRHELSPRQAEALVQRLEDELRDHLQAHGNRAILPE